MAKLETLSDIPGIAPLNANNDRLEAALENTLSRDGSSPNFMLANLDMNGRRIINLPNAVGNTEPVTLAQAGSIAGVDNPLTTESVGAVLYPQTTAEANASVTPTVYSYPPGDVRRYGGVADRSTDSAAALTQAGLVAAQAGGSFVIQAAHDQGYAIASAVTLPYGVSIDADLLYTGSANEAALTIGASPGYQNVTESQYIRLKIERQSVSDWTNNACVGVRIRNLKFSQLDLRDIRGFTIGAELLGDDGGFAYNTVTVGYLFNNKYGLKLTNNSDSSTGFCNQNVFIGSGRIGSGTTTNLGVSRFGVWISSEDGTYVNNNNNVFQGLPFELNASALTGVAEAVAVWVEYGQRNYFYDTRVEGVDVVLRTSNDADLNHVRLGYYSSGTLVEYEDTSTENIVIDDSQAQVHFTRLVTRHSDLGGFAEGISGTSVQIPGLAWGISGGATHYAVSTADVTFDRTTGQITVPATDSVGLYVDTSNVKEFVVRRAGANGGRVRVVPYDSGDAILSGTDVVYGTPTLSANSSFGGGYRTGSDDERDVYFRVSSSVAYVWVQIEGGTAAAEIAEFSIWTLPTVDSPPFAYTTFQQGEKCGSVTLSSGTASVSFAVAEANTSYRVMLSGNTSGEVFTWASKTTSGFTINSDNGSSTAIVDWQICR